MTYSMRQIIAVFIVLVAVHDAASPAQAARVKDVARLDGVRDNALTGYGLVVGLNRTGDTQQALFTVQSVTAMLSRMGVRIDPRRLRTRNVAAVMVTAKLPPFTGSGSRIDVVVSSMGNATSLRGGTLLMAPLKGVDGRVYAVAQGPLSVGGFSTSAAGSRLSRNVATVGRIPSGAIVERTVEFKLNGKKQLLYILNRADFTTATKVAAAITQAGAKARAVDGGRVLVDVPTDMQQSRVAELVAKVESAPVTTDVKARVIVNSRTGTVVIGSNVRIGTVAVAHGSLQIRVESTTAVSQPSALATGTTLATRQAQISANEEKGALRLVNGGASLDDLVKALNALGANSRALIDILEAIKAAGSLDAEIIIQ